MHCEMETTSRLRHYGIAPIETRQLNMQISFQKGSQGMRN